MTDSQLDLPNMLQFQAPGKHILESPAADRSQSMRRHQYGRPVSRDLFEFGSTFATALAVSEAYPTTELAACGGRVIEPKHQIVYLAHVTWCRRCSEMGLSGAEPVWIQTAARQSHNNVHLICCDAWPIRYHH